jgi:hypothetical protein
MSLPAHDVAMVSLAPLHAPAIVGATCTGCPGQEDTVRVIHLSMPAGWRCANQMIWHLPAMECIEPACGGCRGVHPGELAPDGGLRASLGLGFSCSLHLLHPDNLSVRSDQAPSMLLSSMKRLDHTAGFVMLEKFANVAS